MTTREYDSALPNTRTAIYGHVIFEFYIRSYASIRPDYTEGPILASSWISALGSTTAVGWIAIQLPPDITGRNPYRWHRITTK